MIMWKQDNVLSFKGGCAGLWDCYSWAEVQPIASFFYKSSRLWSTVSLCDPIQLSPQYDADALVYFSRCCEKEGGKKHLTWKKQIFPTDENEMGLLGTLKSKMPLSLQSAGQRVSDMTHLVMPGAKKTCMGQKDTLVLWRHLHRLFGHSNRCLTDAGCSDIHLITW